MTSRHSHDFRAARQSGVTLVETLVAMVVVSIGMLGIAGMYVEGLRSSRVSASRQAAVSLASDLADRMRANPTAGLAYQGDAENQDCVNGAENCTPEELAADDLSWWLANLQTQLPDGEGTVDVVEAAGADVRTYTILLTWAESGNASEDRSQYALGVQL